MPPLPAPPDSPPLRPWARALTVLGYGISASILAGIVEAAIRRFGFPGIERLADVGNAFFWILPVGIALVNSPIVAIAAAGHMIRPGVVSLPHGFGHDRPGTRSSVASTRPGPNTNVLMPGTFIDEPSGNAAVNGVPVEVAAV